MSCIGTSSSPLIPNEIAGSLFGFRELSHGDFEGIASLLRSAPPVSFFRLPVLQGYNMPGMATRICIHEGALLVEYTDSAFQFPNLFVTSASILPDSIEERLRDWLAGRESGRIFVTKSCLRPNADGFGKRFKIREAPDMHDYVLSVEHMLHGSTMKLRAKRKHAQRFNTEFPQSRFVTLNTKDDTALRQIEVFWREISQAGAENNGSWHKDLAAFQCCVAQAHLLPMELHAITLDDRILTLQGTEFDQNGYCYAHFHRHLPPFRDVRSCFEFELMKVAETRGCRFYNIGEDMGLPGLRMGKRNWEPIKMLRVHELVANHG